MNARGMRFWTISLPFLELVAMFVSLVNAKFRPLCPRKEHLYLFYRWLTGLRYFYGRCENLAATGIQTTNCSPLMESLYTIILPGHQRRSSCSNKSCTYLCTTQDSLFHLTNIICYLQSRFYIAFKLFVFTTIEIFDDIIYLYVMIKFNLQF